MQVTGIKGLHASLQLCYQPHDIKNCSGKKACDHNEGLTRTLDLSLSWRARKRISLLTMASGTCAQVPREDGWFIP